MSRIADSVNPELLKQVMAREKPKKAVSNAQPFAKHKFKAVRTTVDDIRFDSRLEAEFYEYLKELEVGGQIVGFTRQAPFHLIGNVRHVVDFLVFWADGTVTALDVKGMETATFRVKARQVVATYPWMIFQTVKKKKGGWEYGPYVTERKKRAEK